MRGEAEQRRLAASFDGLLERLQKLDRAATRQEIAARIEAPFSPAPAQFPAAEARRRMIRALKRLRGQCLTAFTGFEAVAAAPVRVATADGEVRVLAETLRRAFAPIQRAKAWRPEELITVSWSPEELLFSGACAEMRCAASGQWSGSITVASARLHAAILGLGGGEVIVCARDGWLHFGSHAFR